MEPADQSNQSRPVSEDESMVVVPAWKLNAGMTLIQEDQEEDGNNEFGTTIDKKSINPAASKIQKRFTNKANPNDDSGNSPLDHSARLRK